jgi:hypothetical protein
MTFEIFVNNTTGNAELSFVWQIETQIATFRSEGTELEHQRQLILSDLEKRQKTLSKQAGEYDERSKELSKVLDQVKSGTLC